MAGPPSPPPTPPPADPGPPPPATEPGLCPNCGAPYDPYQEYCLECGNRLPPPYASYRREIWSSGSPLWLWAALAALLLVALVAGAIVAIAATREDEEGRPRTTIPTTSTMATTTIATTTTTGGTVTWPANRNGYSIFLKSVPTSEGRAKADEAAQRARSNGLTQVGVLNSTNYSSLVPGYWVTFTGI